MTPDDGGRFLDEVGFVDGAHFAGLFLCIWLGAVAVRVTYFFCLGRRFIVPAMGSLVVLIGLRGRSDGVCRRCWWRAPRNVIVLDSTFFFAKLFSLHATSISLLMTHFLDAPLAVFDVGGRFVDLFRAVAVLAWVLFASGFLTGRWVPV